MSSWFQIIHCKQTRNEELSSSVAVCVQLVFIDPPYSSKAVAGYKSPTSAKVTEDSFPNVCKHKVQSSLVVYPNTEIQ